MSQISFKSEVVKNFVCFFADFIWNDPDVFFKISNVTYFSDYWPISDTVTLKQKTAPKLEHI